MNMLLALHDTAANTSPLVAVRHAPAVQIALIYPAGLVEWLTHEVGVNFQEAHELAKHLAGPSTRSATIRVFAPAGNVGLVEETPRHFYTAEGPAGGEFLYLQRLLGGQIGVFAGEQNRLVADRAEIDAAVALLNSTGHSRLPWVVAPVLVHAPRRATRAVP